MRAVLGLCACALGLAGFAWVWDNYSGYLRDRWERSRYPGIRERSPLAESMSRELGERRRQELVREYRRVEALLAAAAREGFDVSALSAKLARVARLIDKGDERLVRSYLNSIELRVPRKKPVEHVAVVNESDFGGEDSGGLEAGPRRPAPKPRRRPRERAP